MIQFLIILTKLEIIKSYQLFHNDCCTSYLSLGYLDCHFPGSGKYAYEVSARVSVCVCWRPLQETSVASHTSRAFEYCWLSGANRCRTRLNYRQCVSQSRVHEDWVFYMWTMTRKVLEMTENGESVNRFFVPLARSGVHCVATVLKWKFWPNAVSCRL